MINLCLPEKEEKYQRNIPGEKQDNISTVSYPWPEWVSCLLQEDFKLEPSCQGLSPTDDTLSEEIPKLKTESDL